MNSTPVFSRRQFIQTSVGATVAVAFPFISTAAARNKIKIGQIGTKHAHAHGKMDAIRKHPEIFEVVGVVEPDAKQRAAVSQRKAYQGLKWMDERELLETSGLKAVAVETDVVDLVSTGLRCIKAGKHIHLDKPAGESMSECRALHAEARRRKLTIQMGYMLRYNPGFQFLFDVLKKGWLGEITEVSGMMGKKMNDAGRKELSQYEGGGMFELACHIVDALIYVLGEPKSITAFNHRSYPDKDTFADNQMAVFDYPKAIGTIRCNHIDPMGGPRRQFNVTGTQGTLEIRPLEAPKVRLGLDLNRGDFKKGFQDVPLPKSPGRYDHEFLDLARIVRGEKSLAWSHDHDLNVHEAVLRACGMAVN
jgi:predicted dehydrogenase